MQSTFDLDFTPACDYMLSKERNRRSLLRLKQGSPKLNSPPQPPTEATPEVGTIAFTVDDERIEISEVEHWVEDGLHVFRSTEFDCIAEAPEEDEAVAQFLQNAEDLALFLDDLMDAGRGTKGELRTLVKLSRRFFEVYRAAELRNIKKRQSLIGGRRKRDHVAEWLPTHASSSGLVRA